MLSIYPGLKCLSPAGTFGATFSSSPRRYNVTLHHRLVRQTEIASAFLGDFILSLTTGPGSLQEKKKKKKESKEVSNAEFLSNETAEQFFPQSS